MGSEWPIVNLGEIIQIKYGKDHKKLNDGEVPCYGSGGIMRYVSEFLYDEESILIPRKGTLNNIFYIDEPFWTVDTLFWSIVDKSSADTKFIYYQLKLIDFNRLNEGSAVPSMTVPIINNIKIKLPAINVQKEVSKILTALDNKITLNRQLNQTLEQMAQALFKSWFVDFDPVLDNALAAGNVIPDDLQDRALLRQGIRQQQFAKADHKPLPENIRKLFPSEFELTESLGWVPKGWDISVSGQKIDVRDGTHDSPQKAENGYPLVTSKNITSGILDMTNAYLISEDDYEKVNQRSKVESGDILLTMIGTVGVPYLITQEKVEFAIKNIGLFRTSQVEKYKYYFYQLLLSQQMQNYLESRVAGTTQKYLSLSALRNIEFIDPKDSILGAFNKYLSGWSFKIQENSEQIESLKKLRDTLLPKLISGELRIPDVEFTNK